VEDFILESSRYVERGIEAMAVLVIACGSLEAFVGVLRIVITRADQAMKREVWMRFAHWLVAGLTFQLASDIVSTTIAPSWQQIGQVSAIALIRAFLTFTLDRELDAKMKEAAA
jgi:uncharacterized membrane protein